MRGVYKKQNAVVSEHAGVGHTNEEKAFFYREVKQIDSGNVPGVKTPDAAYRKKVIPNQEYDRCYKTGRKKILPLFVETYFGVKREYEREKQACRINKQVCEFFRHLLNFFSAFRALLLWHP